MMIYILFKIRKLIFYLIILTLLIFSNLNQNHVMKDHANRWYVTKGNHIKENHINKQYVTWNYNIENDGEKHDMTGMTAM